MIEKKEKQCKVCNLKKTIDDFPIARTNKDGRSNRCRDCDYKQHRERLKQKREYNEQFGII